MARLFWICLGGAAGTAARYLLSGWMSRSLGPGFPYGTLAVNVIGSFLIAVLMYLGLETSLMSATLRLALTTGVMGGFTTYSTFSYETLKLFQEGSWGVGALNVAVTLAGCLAACWLGWVSSRFLVGT